LKTCNKWWFISKPIIIYVVELVHILMIELFDEILFWFVGLLSTTIIIIKRLQSTNFNGNLSLKFYILKKNHKEQSLSLKLLNVFEIMEFTSYDFKKLFIYTLCYDNVGDNEFFRLWNVVLLKKCLG
jgi:hypothetical protein